ncbi:MAG: hypothetical protein ACLPN6_03655 [Streptosporangiaceae bacterium]
MSTARTAARPNVVVACPLGYEAKPSVVRPASGLSTCSVRASPPGIATTVSTAPLTRPVTRQVTAMIAISAAAGIGSPGSASQSSRSWWAR